METPLLFLDQISVSINGREILHDISLTIQKHRVTTIIGPSGAGKTTLLRTVNLLRMPAKGKILFRGECVFDSVVRNTRKHPVLSAFSLNGYSEAFRSNAFIGSE